MLEHAEFGRLHPDMLQHALSACVSSHWFEVTETTKQGLFEAKRGFLLCWIRALIFRWDVNTEIQVRLTATRFFYLLVRRINQAFLGFTPILGWQDEEQYVIKVHYWHLSKQQCILFIKALMVNMQNKEVVLFSLAFSTNILIYRQICIFDNDSSI